MTSIFETVVELKGGKRVIKESHMDFLHKGRRAGGGSEPSLGVSMEKKKAMNMKRNEIHIQYSSPYSKQVRRKDA